MKKYLYLIFIILLITNVSSLIAGRENIITTIPQCEHLFVNVTGTKDIHVDEYSFPNCLKLEEDNYWFCECTDNYDLIIDLHLRAMNNYTFFIESFYEGGPTIITNTRTRTNTIVINETQYKDPIVEKETETIVETVIEEVEVIVKEKEYINETTPIIIQEAEKSRWWLWLIIAILVIIIAFLLLFYYSYKDSNADYIPVRKEND